MNVEELFFFTDFVFISGDNIFMWKTVQASLLTKMWETQFFGECFGDFLSNENVLICVFPCGCVLWNPSVLIQI